MVKDDLLYTEDHEWVKIEDDIATMGITDFAQSNLGDIVYVEILGLDSFNTGDVIGSIEAVKTVSDIFSPVHGEIIEINESLEELPDQVNNDPYGMGWIAKIKLDDNFQTDSLLKPEDYQELIE